MSTTGADSTGVGENLPTEAPQVSTVVQVAAYTTSVTVNIFTGTLQGILGFTINQIGFWWTMDMTAKSQLFIRNSNILRSGAS